MMRSAAATATIDKIIDTKADNSIPARAGVGLKAGHYREILDTGPDLGWFEVHPENYMGAGGAPHHYLNLIRQRYPLSMHGVGMSIGGAGPLDAAHLARWRELAARYEPGLVSEHLAWSGIDGVFLNDLLPLPYTEEALRRVCDHIDEVQTTLGRRILIENPATYLRPGPADMDEPEFLDQMSARSGCGLLFDVTNLYISARNHGFDVADYLQRVPLERVGEIHLAGHAVDAATDDGTGQCLLIDNHGSAVGEVVWSWFEYLLARTGPCPSLIEWDADIPAFMTLLQEAERAERIAARAAVRQRGSLPPYCRRVRPRRRADMAGNSTKLGESTGLYGFQAGFARTLLDDPAGRVEPVDDRTERALAVYRNNVLHSLTQALATAFPVVRRLTGEDFFNYAAWTFARRHPPQSPLMIEVGQRFDRFLDNFEPAAGLPYLADVARLEQAWLGAYHAADAPPLAPSALAAIAPERHAGLRFQLHPATRIVASKYPIVAIWQANTGNREKTRIALQAGDEYALVTRPHLQVSVCAIEPGLASLIGALGQGEALSAALDRAIEAQPDLALDLALRDLLANGCVTALQTEP